eukprot:11202960-Lingulodinium_polyedra.AAC.1
MKLHMKICGAGESTDAPAAGGAPVLTGPDWSVAPSRKDLLEVELPKTAVADFDAGKVLYKVKAQPNLPEVIVTKDYKVYLHVDDGINASPLKMEPCEIWGFNYGEFKTDTQAKLSEGGAWGLCCPLSLMPKLAPAA